MPPKAEGREKGLHPTRMKFGQALEMLNTGKEVMRAAQDWKIALNRDPDGKPSNLEIKSKGGPVGSRTWNPRHEDLLSEDWQVAEF